MNKEFKKVTVFTPMTILESIEYTDANITHEDIVYSMLSENIWINYKEDMEQKEHPDATILHGLPVNLRASYLAFSVGFSVLYESENELMFFISDEVNEEMIHYIEGYCEEKSKYLLFITYIKNMDETRKAYMKETNNADIPIEKQYDDVMNEMLQILHIKTALLETKKSL